MAAGPPPEIARWPLQRAIAIRSSEDVSGLGAPLVPLQSPGLALNAAVAADVGHEAGSLVLKPM